MKTRRSILALALIGMLGMTATSCNKDYNNYYGTETAPVESSKGENYDVPQSYIVSHKFKIVAHSKTPLNEDLAWKVQGLDENGNPENMFVIIADNKGLPNYYHREEYQLNGIIDGLIIWRLLEVGKKVE